MEYTCQTVLSFNLCAFSSHLSTEGGGDGVRSFFSATFIIKVYWSPSRRENQFISIIHCVAIA